ncbi:ScyD/ScyE family protein [Knoellia aerolata]|uniref:ScyD/ScyE family protein n=1 Tax=Knoellia aerolata DSM 18566 TaxID=1385519 RepID=A0A0A0JSG6_9MICO|nr:ScyD/ScyE family protein [Knoellia aerolata]KGN39649.1 hypothetical protein N801_18030 [Knoellia aerolata DSM 18566]
MRHRKTLGFAATAALATAVATFSAPSTAAAPGPVVVASGLNNPRQLTFAPGGSLYVAESGIGGDDACGTHPEFGPACVGPSGAIARVGTGGTVTRVVTGLPSLASAADTIGPSDITFTGNHRYAVTVGLGAPPSLRDELGAPGARLAHVLTGDLRSAGLADAFDLAAYETSANPDGTDLDTNPVGLARWGNTFVVADAGANAVVRTNDTTVATLPPVPATGPNAPFPGFAADAVPTDVVRGPDGAWYVSQLVGYPFEKGSSSIWRVVPGSAPMTWATGLTNVTSIDFADDGRLYAVEIAENGLLSGPIGRLARVTPGGSTHATVAGGLFAPYGVATRGSQAWVTTGSVLPGGGQVVRVSLG